MRFRVGALAASLLAMGPCPAVAQDRDYASLLELFNASVETIPPADRNILFSACGTWSVEALEAAVNAPGGDNRTTEDSLLLATYVLSERLQSEGEYRCGAVLTYYRLSGASAAGSDQKIAGLAPMAVEASNRAAATGERDVPIGAARLAVLGTAVSYYANGRKESSGAFLCFAETLGLTPVAPILDSWDGSLECRNGSAPDRPTQQSPSSPIPPPPTPPPPPAVTVKPAPAPPPPPAQQGEIEAVTSPVPGYTNCRRIPLDYYDPDGQLVSESMVMCQDRNGEFIEVEGVD